jgi:hypothetical protein
MAGIPTSNILQPGVIASTSGATQALISTLQLLTPQYYKAYVEKYGNEDFTWFLATYGGMELVQNFSAFKWYENRGKNQIAISNTTKVTTPSAGATVTVTQKGGYFNSGTQSPIRAGETLRIASNNVEGTVLAITGTTANAFTFTVAPKLSTVAFAGPTGSLEADEVLILGGLMDVGEGSTQGTTQIHLDQSYSNTVTEAREDWSATDEAEMSEVWYTSGVSGSEMAGGAQAGTSYFTYKGLVKSNMRFINNVEFKLMRGSQQTNTNITGGSNGTQGFIPKVLADGETVQYTPGLLNIQKLHEITRIMDVNGNANQNMWLMDVFMRQNFSDGIFSEFPAGAFVWGQGEKSQDASVAYGFESIKIDGYLFNVKKYRQFNTEVTTGVTPTTDAFRNFGIICPNGTATDARDSTKQYKNISVMYMNPTKGGTTGNGIRVWQHGGASVNATNGTLTDNVSMVTYRGLRVVAANQFIAVQAG